MDRRGFSLIELVIAIVLIGLMAAFMMPRIGDVIQKQKVRSARNAITTMHARARATAIRLKARRRRTMQARSASATMFYAQARSKSPASRIMRRG